jgi:hypothetical protein
VRDFYDSLDYAAQTKLVQRARETINKLARNVPGKYEIVVCGSEDKIIEKGRV